MDVATPLREAIRSSDAKRLRAGFGFATLDGVKRVFDVLRGERQFEQLPKEIIVGVGHGITQPVAIRQLASLPNCDVRLFVGEKRRLTRDALLRPAAFHAKAVIVHGGRDQYPRYVLASSANLTGAAVGASPSNFELGTIARLSDSDGRRLAPQVDGWWRAAEALSITATLETIDRYAQLRLAFLAERPELIDLQPPEMGIADADHFWIEIGAASGYSRHQIEFPEALAYFFGRPNRDTATVTLRFGKVERSDRPIAYKKTSFGVEIWRLSMLTASQGGPAYQGRVVQFTREAPLIFRMKVTDVGSAEARRWRRAANDFGQLGRTGGGQLRAYGYY